MKQVKFLVAIMTSIFLLVGCSHEPGKVMVTSLSSDGSYVVTGGDNNSVLLWNIKNRSYKIISTHGNALSPYFIKNTNKFLWQDNKTKVVYVEDVNGKIVKKLPVKHTVSSGIMTSDLRYYFSVDDHWNKWRYDTKSSKSFLFDGQFMEGGDPFHMILSMDSKLLLTSGYCGNHYDNIPLDKPDGKTNLDCVTLWDVEKAEPIRKFWGLVSQTYVTLSPDKKHVIGSDISAHIYVYNASEGNLIKQLDDIYDGKFVRVAHTGNLDKDYKWFKDGIKQPPKDFVNWQGEPGSETPRAIRYLTKDQYVTVNNDVTYAILYKGLNRKPTKYLPLGKMPWPSDYDLSRDGSIDSSPSAHVLVTGQEAFDGINVYQYDPKTETLYRVWTPIINLPKTAPPLSKDVPTLPGVKFDDLLKVKREGWW